MGQLLLNERTTHLWTPPDPRVIELHRRLAGYAPTELRSFDQPAGAPGIGRLLVKAETQRFGLPAFKALGASWAVAQLLSQRLGPDVAWETFDDLAHAVRAHLGEVTLVAATDGNHGRAVARMAKLLGQPSIILVPEDTVDARITAIAGEGAEVRVVAGTYDDAVRASAALASDHAVVVSDTSWPGYQDSPRWVIEGYSTIFQELDAQLDAFGGWSAVDVVLVPLGVGAFGSAAATHIRSDPARMDRPLLVGVEPDSAACCLAAVEAGEIVEVPGPHRSIMAGLNCGTASMIALPTMQAGFDAFLTISDDRCRDAIRWLAAEGLDVGECGAAGVAALAELHDVHPGDLGLPPEATALVIATEGVTDPVSFEAVVGRPPR
jgi:diaminopropionate ammonia-lyase